VEEGRLDCRAGVVGLVLRVALVDLETLEVQGCKVRAEELVLLERLEQVVKLDLAALPVSQPRHHHYHCIQQGSM